MTRYIPLLVSCLVLGSSPAFGAVINLSSSIDGPSANMGLGTGSAGTGSATLTFDDASNLLSWSGSFAGLGSDYLVSHFHGPALPNANAGVTVGFAVVLNPDNRSGTFNGNAILTAGQAAELLADLWYINIHSDDFSGGEIRGQVLVPEASTVALMALGLLGIASRRRH